MQQNNSNKMGSRRVAENVTALQLGHASSFRNGSCLLTKPILSYKFLRKAQTRTQPIKDHGFFISVKPRQTDTYQTNITRLQKQNNNIAI